MVIIRFFEIKNFEMQFGHTVLKRNFDKNQYFIFIFKIYK
ncbi:hypothetical protein BCH308197_3070 [Bacillus cereus H3081.97]|uniref:Uncharacterized protein n=1 Tax=Bacillus cereus (strain AH187) TaxID=405534 RepID=B7HWL4_BACC7|nr:hypothetical protein BCAH187_A3143 [Bacillus cereus AH187]EDZ58457.1 hypothetical protein BCH308197_3070 [Bacillus cereus H3081.97]KKZ90694.1 hypothetical protein B4086_2887 [Bacillus cereus]KLA05311.1 hypothetical protein B4153_3173 [Bacillus cereus]KLA21504.1 hypothetical protein B4078_2885 [Bacillus cereus]